MADLAALENEHQSILDSVRAMIWFKTVTASCGNAAADARTSREDASKRAEELIREAEAYLKEIGVIESGRPKLGVIEPLALFDGTKRWCRPTASRTTTPPARSSASSFTLDVTERKRAGRPARRK